MKKVFLEGESPTLIYFDKEFRVSKMIAKI